MMTIRLFRCTREHYAIRKHMMKYDDIHTLHVMRYARGHDKRHLRELVKLKVMCDKGNLF